MPNLPERRLIIDSDTASDDAVALLLAAAAQHAEVRAVTTVAGNVPLEVCTRNAIYTLQLAGLGHVPVHPGCERPLLREYASAQHVHGTDGMSDTNLPTPDAPAASEHAVNTLLRLAYEAPAGTYTLVTLGPLTNVAAAVARDRNLLSRFRHTYAMAGAPDAYGNISATAEFNVWADPEAAAIVLADATPDLLTFVGWDVSRRDAVMTSSDRGAIRALGTPLALFADRINRAVLDWTTNVTGLEGYDLPDPITMAVALDPQLITGAENAHVRVATADETRGQLIVDRRVNAHEPNVRLVRRVDGDGFKTTLLAACARESTFA